MTEKQNYLMVINGQQPEWIPYYSYGPNPIGKPVPAAHGGPSILVPQLLTPGPAKDIWGVTYVPVAEAGGAKLPEPNNFILKDIRKWRDVIKAPDFSDVDWETLAKKDLEYSNIDRENSAFIYGLNGGYFQALMAFMGFTEGLCAMHEEPDEVKALMEYICDFYMDVAEKSMHYYNPDIIAITDDTATWKNPFISIEMYRDLIKPSHVKQGNLGKNNGLPVVMHNCGRCEDFIDDWREFGVMAWDPAQTSNNLTEIKEKHGNNLVITGGWDIEGELHNPDCSEDVIKQSVYEVINKYAPGGGYVFFGAFLGFVDDERIIQKNRWIAEAVDTYGKSFYK